MSRELNKRGRHATTRRTLSAAALTAALLALVSAAPAGAQSDPLASAGRTPFVLVLLDTSASVEYTSLGDGYHPIKHFETYTDPDELENWPLDCAPLDADGDVKMWSPKCRILGGGAYGASAGPKMVGSCYVWEPRCNQYERPPWYPSDDYLHFGANKLTSGNQLMRNRYEDMRGEVSYNLFDGSITKTGNLTHRLTDDNQPRHVQLKEILTGDMVLRPRINGVLANIANSLDPLRFTPDEYGPGCWFVPRMHNTSAPGPRDSDAGRLCFEPSLYETQCERPFDMLGCRSKPATDPDCLQLKRTCAEGLATGTYWQSNHSDAFQKHVDYKDPRPHFQEVFDYQHPTGILDTLSSLAIVGVAMLDSYPGQINPAATPNPDGTMPSDAQVTTMLNDSTQGNIAGQKYGGESATMYNLGVYKVIAPKTFAINEADLPAVAAYSQLALVDAGYLHHGHGDRWTVDPSRNNQRQYGTFSFEGSLSEYVSPYQAGQQPISASTPLAAAIYDIHNFFVNGQAEFNADGTPVSDPTRHHNPVQDDRYKACRPKHVVVLTDGEPAPEIDPNIDAQLSEPNPLGTEAIGALYDMPDFEARYPYGSTEHQIRRFVTDPTLTVQDKPQFDPHVHVVGLSQQVDPDAPEAGHIRRKLGNMARLGNTCAEYWLFQSEEGRAYIPYTRSMLINNITVPGTCDPAVDNCLMEQLTTEAEQFPPTNLIDSPETPVLDKCVSPALILAQNDRFLDKNDPRYEDRQARDDLSYALTVIFNQVLIANGGVSSRTRPSLSTYLDTANVQGQHRLYSGLQITGGSSYWKGLLNRQDLFCEVSNGVPSVDPSTATVRPLHDDIKEQVRLVGTVIQDNRRIFTSLRRENPSDPTNGGIPSATHETPVIFSGYDLVKLPSPAQDEFRTSPLNNSDADLLGTRIPLRLRQLTRAVLNQDLDPSLEDLTDVLGVRSIGETQRVVNALRGRQRERMDRVLGPIMTGNPVTVGPPAADVAIESYRAYRERFSKRPTMLYVPTLNGMLHAIYTGDHTGATDAASGLGIVRRAMGGSSTDPFTDGAENIMADTDNASPVVAADGSQREAWAYVPQMLRRRYQAFTTRQGQLMDASPAVKDVRLCHSQPELNQNRQACLSATDGTTIPEVEQWRTVLVQPMGRFDAGYFALDVTRTGGWHKEQMTPPDPIALWEFDPSWEQAQILKLTNGANQQFRYTTTSNNLKPNGWDESGLTLSGCPNNTRPSLEELDKLSYMGASVSEAEIATVILQVKENEPPVQRAVAIFSAGQSGISVASPSDCLKELRQGRAIYIVDLQTGSLLRRFVSFTNAQGDEQRFDYEVAGAPAAYPSAVGTVASRAFLGDGGGRLFRINLASANIQDWAVDLMYDPCVDEGFSIKPENGPTDACDVTQQRPFRLMGTSSFKPATSAGRDRSVVVVYGLGDRHDLVKSNRVEAVIALKESVEQVNTNGATADQLAQFELQRATSGDDSIVLWRHLLLSTDKLTSEPSIFNFGVYYTVYRQDPTDVCEPGTSLIYGLDFEGVDGAIRGVYDLVELGLDNGSVDGVAYEPDLVAPKKAIWVGPTEPTLIRGLAITLGASCTDTTDDATTRQFTERVEPRPELITITSGAAPPTNSNFGEGSADSTTGQGTLTRFKIQLTRPRSQTLSLSWASVAQ